MTRRESIFSDELRADTAIFSRYKLSRRRNLYEILELSANSMKTRIKRIILFVQNKEYWSILEFEVDEAYDVIFVKQLRGKFSPPAIKLLNTDDQGDILNALVLMEDLLPKIRSDIRKLRGDCSQVIDRIIDNCEKIEKKADKIISIACGQLSQLGR